MKFGRLGGPDGVELVDRDPPVPGPGEVTVRLAACGVCGTDLEKVRGNYRTAGVIGHEPVGRIEAVGAGVDPLRPGDRVFAHHHVACGTCAVCARGEPTFCPTYSRTNLDPGGFAELFRVPKENVERGAVLRLADSVGWDAGALLEPAGCALTALRTVGSPQTAVVLGLGPVGLLYARLLKARGALWVGGTEISDLRRRAAERGGIDTAVDPREPTAVSDAVQRGTGGVGADLVVVATGHPAVVRSAFDLVRRGGTVNLFGLPEAGSRLDVDLQQLYLRGIRVVPTYATTEADVREVHRLLVERALAIDDLVTDRFPLSAIGDAFRAAAQPDRSVKVVVTGSAY